MGGCAVSAVQTDLDLVNRLPDAHRFKWVGGELHITSQLGWEDNEAIVDRSRPISMDRSGAMLPVTMLRELGRPVRNAEAADNHTPVAIDNALVYAAAFRMRIWTGWGYFTVEGPTL